MITSRDIANHLGTLLNRISVENDLDIVFEGTDGFYHHEWVKEKFDIKITPFVLTTNLIQRTKSNENSYEFRYTLVAMPFEKDREKIRFLYNELNQELDRYKINDYNLRFIPSNVAFGADFAEGSGLGFRRFEALFEFEGVATTSYGLEDLSLDFGGYNIPINSFKYEHSKTNFINKEENYLGDNNFNLNSNLLIVETILSPENHILNYLNKRQMVNIETPLKLKVGNEVIIEDNYVFENYTIRGDANQDKILAYLNFEIAPDKTVIQIGGKEIPVLDYAFAMATNLEHHNEPNSNITKSIYLGKTRSYAFNVVEDKKYNDILNKLTGELIGEDETMPIYQVLIIIRGTIYEKKLMLVDISKESRGTSSTVLSIKFVDGSDL